MLMNQKKLKEFTVVGGLKLSDQLSNLTPPDSIKLGYLLALRELSRDQAGTQGNLQKKLKRGKSDVSYLTKKYVEAELIEAYSLGRPRFYRLTYNGETILGLAKVKSDESPMAQGVSSTPIGLQKSTSHYNAVERERPVLICRTHDIWTVADVHGWQESLGKKLEAAHFRKSPAIRGYQYTHHLGDKTFIQFIGKKCIMVFPGIVSDSAYKGLAVAHQLWEKSRKDLEKRFGFVLGKPHMSCKVRRQSHGLLFDTIASAMKDQGISYFSEDIDIDASHKLPELEFKDKVKAAQHYEDYADFVRSVIHGRFNAEKMVKDVDEARAFLGEISSLVRELAAQSAAMAKFLKEMKR